MKALRELTRALILVQRYVGDYRAAREGRLVRRVARRRVLGQIARRLPR